MPAYVIGHIRITEPDLWQEYRSAVPATLTPFGGELLFRGQLAAVLGGKHERDQTVAIRFSDRASAQRWFDSDAYQQLIPLRERAAQVDLLLFDALA